MKTRAQIVEVKRNMLFASPDHSRVDEIAKCFGSHTEELEHFKRYLEAGGSDAFAHTLAFEFGIQNNMKLAEFLSDLQCQVNRLTYPDND